MSETPQVDVDIVVPVKNEEHDLEPSVIRLVEHLRDAFPFSARVTIADNGSTDGTWLAACALEDKYPEVRAVHLDIPGRGRALHEIWSCSDAEVLAYMDVDLSTDLNALLPLVEDKGWFFDTELLVLAERAGLRIHEVPVDWVDDADSRVNIVDTALGDLRGMTRLGLGLARGTIKVPRLRETGPGPSRGLAWQVPRFAAIGAASTLAYIVVFLALRGYMGAQAANALSLLLTAVVNTAANRRLTFGVTGRAGAAVHHFRGLIAFGVCLALTSGALLALHAVSASPAGGTEIAVLVGANLVATALRFVLYRGWVFAEPQPTPPAPLTAPTAPRQSLGDAR